MIFQCRAKYPVIFHFFEDNINVPRSLVVVGRGAWDDSNIAWGRMRRKAKRLPS